MWELSNAPWFNSSSITDRTSSSSASRSSSSRVRGSSSSGADGDYLLVSIKRQLSIPLRRHWTPPPTL